MSRAIENLPFLIEEWSSDDKVRLEVLARASEFAIAKAAHEAALKQRPHTRIVFRLGAQDPANRAPLAEVASQLSLDASIAPVR